MLAFREMSGAGTSRRSITRMLRDWSRGESDVLEDLLPLVHSELRRQAHNYLRRERPDHTLQTSALINEAFIRLVDRPTKDWNGRTHFFAFAANLMRQVLIDYARAKNRKKRGGDVVRLTLDERIVSAPDEKSIDLIALDEALNKLSKIDPRQVQIVELRYFSGLTMAETAEALQISRSTVARDWSVAKAWLHRELTRQE